MFTPAENIMPSEPESTIERRFYPRIAPIGPVRVAFADDNLGILLNLSENGLLVSTPLALLQNFVCRVSLLLTGLAQPIDVYARVVWTSDSRLSGIQLLDLGDEDREQIRQWAAMEEDRRVAAEPEPSVLSRVAASAATGIPTPRASEKSVGKPSAPLKLSSSLLPLAAGVLAMLLMLGTALILRGTSLRGLLNHSFKPETPTNMAMQPGGAVANESPDAQSAGSMPAAQQSSHQSASAPALAPVSAPQADASQPASTGAPSPASTSSIRSVVPAKNKDIVSPAKSLAPKAPTTVTPLPTKFAAAAPVRNRSILEAKEHFGDQYIGHLDLAGSGGNENAQPGTPAPETSTPLRASTAGPGSSTLPQPDGPKSNSSANTASAPPGSSAINGSIARDAAHSETVTHDSESIPPTFPAVSKNANSPGAAPQPASSSPKTASAANPPTTITTTPQNRTLQLTLPNAARASYINLPGEQVLQSPSMTLHIQRAILAPAAPVASAAPRKETVVVGDLLSHVEPWTPHLTQETGNRVGVRAFLSADGHVEKLVPVNGSVALVSSAVRAVRQWQFQPTLLEGRPVQMAVYVLVEFHPEAANGSAQP